MKFIYTKIMILLGVLISIPAFSADTIKVFNADAKPIQTPFYAETVFALKSNSIKIKSFRNSTTVWYQNPESYRMELRGFPTNGNRSIVVRSGEIGYSTMYRQGRREKWAVMPMIWMGDPLADLYNKREMKNPRLVGIEEMHGMKVQHWHGSWRRKHAIGANTMDIWLSLDKRFPIILKSKIINLSRGIVTYEITKLRLGESIPGYMLTPQIDPKDGLMALVNSPAKPIWITIIWYLVYLLSYGLLIYAIGVVRSGNKRIFLLIIYGFVFIGIVNFPSRLDRYMNQYSGLPVFILMAVMTIAVLRHCLRRFPVLGGIRIFSGTRWSIIIWIIVSLCYGLYSGICHTAAAYGRTSSHLWFLLPSLLNLSLCYMIFAALEEVVFRGYLMGVLTRRFTSGRVVNVLQSLAFTLIHIPRLMNEYSNHLTFIGGLVGIFVMGLIFGGLRLRYKNLGAPWLVHVVYNIGFQYGTIITVYDVLNRLR